MPLTEIKKPITVKGDDSKDNLGLVHVITGDGRGKTTSSLGLGLRAIGNNLRVHMVQFLKSGFTGELYSAKKLGFEIEQFGVDALKEKQQKLQEFEDKTSRFIFQPDIKEKDAALEGWHHAKNIRSTSANIVKGRAYIAHFLSFIKAIAPTMDSNPIIIPMAVSATICDT